MVKVGEEVEIIGFKDTAKTTITGIEMFNKSLKEGIAGDNAGLLLRGTGKDDVTRGMVLAKTGSVKPPPVEEDIIEGEVFEDANEEGEPDEFADIASEAVAESVEDPQVQAHEATASGYKSIWQRAKDLGRRALSMWEQAKAMFGADSSQATQAEESVAEAQKDTDFAKANFAAETARTVIAQQQAEAKLQVGSAEGRVQNSIEAVEKMAGYVEPLWRRLFANRAVKAASYFAVAFGLLNGTGYKDEEKPLEKKLQSSSNYSDVVKNPSIPGATTQKLHDLPLELAGRVIKEPVTTNSPSSTASPESNSKALNSIAPPRMASELVVSETLALQMLGKKGAEGATEYVSYFQRMHPKLINALSEAPSLESMQMVTRCMSWKGTNMAKLAGMVWSEWFGSHQLDNFKFFKTEDPRKTLELMKTRGMINVKQGSVDDIISQSLRDGRIPENGVIVLDKDGNVLIIGVTKVGQKMKMSAPHEPAGQPTPEYVAPSISSSASPSPHATATPNARPLNRQTETYYKARRESSEPTPIVVVKPSARPEEPKSVEHTTHQSSEGEPNIEYSPAPSNEAPRGDNSSGQDKNIELPVEIQAEPLVPNSNPGPSVAPSTGPSPEPSPSSTVAPTPFVAGQGWVNLSDKEKHDALPHNGVTIEPDPKVKTTSVTFNVGDGPSPEAVVAPVPKPSPRAKPIPRPVVSPHPEAVVEQKSLNQADVNTVNQWVEWYDDSKYLTMFKPNFDNLTPEQGRAIKAALQRAVNDKNVFKGNRMRVQNVFNQFNLKY